MKLVLMIQHIQGITCVTGTVLGPLPTVPRPCVTDLTLGLCQTPNPCFSLYVAYR